MAAVAGALLLAGSYTAVAAAASTAPSAGPVPKGFEPISMTFVSARDGWVLGTAPCSHKPCTSVVRTTNGGRTWVGIPAPRLALAQFSINGLNRIRFADTSDGFAYGSQLWVTHDGGAGWYRLRQVPGYINDLEASAGVVYAAGVKANRVTIYRTPAGIDGWHKVSGLPVVASNYGLTEITLHGAAAWIVLGSRIYASATGAHWRRLAFQCPKELAIASVAAYNQHDVSVLCTGDAGLGSSAKVLYTSTDGGAHLAKAGSPPLGGDGGVLAQPGPRHLLIATSSGATWMYSSYTGGKHWRIALTLADGGKGWADFGFTTATQGVAVEGIPEVGSHMYITTNGGASWHKVTF